MFRRIRKHANPASLIAMVALFAALGGVSYAAATINGKNIKNGTIAGKKLKNKAVTGGKVKSDSLTGTQIKESTLSKVPSAGQADNAANAQNAVAAQTAATVGPDGVGAVALQSGSVTSPKLGSAVRRPLLASIPANSSSLVRAECEPGERVLSGGGVWAGAVGAIAADLHVVHSFPTNSNDWSVRVYNGTGDARDFTAYALCLQV